MPFQKIPHLVVISHDVEIKQPFGVLEDEPLFQSFAAFVKAVPKIAHAKAAVFVDLAERLTNCADQRADFLAFRLRKRTQRIEQVGIEISP